MPAPHSLIDWTRPFVKPSQAYVLEHPPKRKLGHPRASYTLGWEPRPFPTSLGKKSGKEKSCPAQRTAFYHSCSFQLGILHCSTRPHLLSAFQLLRRRETGKNLPSPSTPIQAEGHQQELSHCDCPRLWDSLLLSFIPVGPEKRNYFQPVFFSLK